MTGSSEEIVPNTNPSANGSKFESELSRNGYDWKVPNPFSDALLPKSRKRKQSGRHATHEDVLNMLTACAGVDTAKASKLGITLEQAKTAMSVIAMAAFSGLRKSEIQGLRWEHLNDGNIHVRQIAWRPTVNEQTKTEASTDSVPVMKTLADYLGAHRNGFPPQVGIPGDRGH